MSFLTAGRPEIALIRKNSQGKSAGKQADLIEDVEGFQLLAEQKMDEAGQDGPAFLLGVVGENKPLQEAEIAFFPDQESLESPRAQKRFRRAMGPRSAIAAFNCPVFAIEQERPSRRFFQRALALHAAVQKGVVAQQLQHPQFEQADYPVCVQAGIDQSQEGNKVIKKLNALFALQRELLYELQEVRCDKGVLQVVPDPLVMFNYVAILNQDEFAAPLAGKYHLRAAAGLERIGKPLAAAAGALGNAAHFSELVGIETAYPVRFPVIKRVKDHRFSLVCLPAGHE